MCIVFGARTDISLPHSSLAGNEVLELANMHFRVVKKLTSPRLHRDHCALSACIPTLERDVTLYRHYSIIAPW